VTLHPEGPSLAEILWPVGSAKNDWVDLASCPVPVARSNRPPTRSAVALARPSHSVFLSWGNRRRCRGE